MVRNTFNSLYHLGFALIFSFVIGFTAYGEELIEAPMPDWVELTNLIEITKAAEAAEAETNYYGQRIYSEIHTNYLGQTPVTFRRYAFKINNLGNVQSTPQVTIAYAPQNQAYELHNVIIWRDAEPLNMLHNTRASFMTFTSQDGVASSEGSASVQLFIPNLIEDDVVEVSFSVKGQNSAFRDLAFGTVQETAYTVHRTILMPSNKNLYFEYSENDEKHLIERLDNADKYTWNWDLITNPISDKHRYRSLSHLTHFSEFSEWHELVNWAEELFPLDQPHSHDVENLAKKLTKDAKTDEEKIKALTSYMKTEIRYVNIELDRHGYRPFPPSDVLKKRYGDCKDQAMLLVALLKTVDIEAWPALVVSNDNAFVPEALVTPYAFNHLIVQVMINGETFWIDPTESTYKGAPIWLDLPNFDNALVLRDGENALTEINQDNVVAELKIVREYSFPNGLAGGGSSISDIVANGRLAGEFRKRATKYDGTLNLGDPLRNEKRTFKSAAFVSEPELLESEDANSIRITLEYNYPEPLPINKKNNAYRVDLKPDVVRQGFSRTYGNNKREKSLKLQFPFKATQNYIFDAKGDFEFEPYEIEIKSDYHHFKHKRYFVDDVFHVDFSYQTLKKEVNVEDVADFKDDMKQLKDEAQFTLWQYDPDPEYHLLDDVKGGVFPKLYKNTPRHTKATARLNAHYDKKAKLDLTDIEALSELMKWDDLPKDSLLKIRWYYARNLFFKGRYTEALETLDYIIAHANSVGSRVHSMKGFALQQLNKPLESLKELRQSLEKLESGETRHRHHILNAFNSSLSEISLGKDTTAEDVAFIKETLTFFEKGGVTQENKILGMLLGMYWQLDDQENIIKTLIRQIDISPNALDWSQLVRVYQLANENELADAEIEKLKEAGFELRELVDEDGDPLAFYRPSAAYPRRANEMGIEGFAITEIDISKTGVVTACRIIEQSLGAIFGKASCSAAMRSRFFPAYKDGVAIERIGNRMKYTFNLN